MDDLAANSRRLLPGDRTLGKGLSADEEQLVAACVFVEVKGVVLTPKLLF